MTQACKIAREREGSRRQVNRVKDKIRDPRPRGAAAGGVSKGGGGAKSLGFSPSPPFERPASRASQGVGWGFSRLPDGSGFQAIYIA
ncbi:hypothetical protein Ms3S1_00710 [Methylosinus sp. 3S-1]